MRIVGLELENFKRFTKLTLAHIPATAKLVLLIGANGSGKSSVFDAFEAVNTFLREDYSAPRNDSLTRYYFKENGSFRIKIDTDNAATNFEFIQRAGPYNPQRIGSAGPLFCFFGRTSFRQVGALQRTQLGQSGEVSFSTDGDRPRLFIDRDLRFETDVERITEAVVRGIFQGKSTSNEIQDDFIRPINDAFAHIFGIERDNRLELTEIIPPLQGKVSQINFKKGGSVFHYNFLSAGEKEIFNILIDLKVRRDHFKDSIYFFDELDLHLNTAIQQRFLKEIVEHWIPENCQVWTASHALGFIDYARRADNAVVINFDDLNFDIPQTLAPEPKENLDVYDIAVPQDILFELLSGKRIVVCENQNDEYYNSLLLANTVFVGAKDARDVFLHVKRDSRYFGLRDRDFISDTEIARICAKYANYRILQYYCFENYAYHPDNLAELNLAGFDRVVYVEEITRQKKERQNYILMAVASSRQTYEELKTDGVKDKDANSIADDFGSDEFERFYKFYDMKNHFDKSTLGRFKLSKKLLVSTQWFKSKIQSLLA